MDVPKYAPERCFQGLHSHKTHMVTGVVYDIENAKLGCKMVYYNGLCNYGVFTGPYLVGAYIINWDYQELQNDTKIIQID